MYPNTAMNLRESGGTKIKEFIQVAKGFSVTHLMLFSGTDNSNYLRIAKLPEGPTITFKIMNYSHKKDILNS